MPAAEGQAVLDLDEACDEDGKQSQEMCHYPITIFWAIMDPRFAFCACSISDLIFKVQMADGCHA